MNRVFRFLAGVGRLVGKAMSVIRDIVSDEQLAAGLALVKQAEVKFIDNDQRRAWVVRQLRAVGIPEGVARIIVELALKLAKKEAASITDKVAGAA